MPISTRAALIEAIVDGLDAYEPSEPHRFDPTVSRYEALAEAPPSALPNDVTQELWQARWSHVLSAGALVLVDLLIKVARDETLMPMVQRFLDAMDRLVSLRNRRMAHLEVA